MPTIIIKSCSNLFFVFFTFVVLYFFIFQPPFFNKIYYVLVELVVFVFFAAYKFNFFLKYINLFKFEVFASVLIVFLSLFRDFFSGDVVYSDRFLVWFFQCILFPSFFIYYFYFIKNKSDYHNGKFLDIYIGYLFLTFFVASLITILLFFIPEFDSFYKGIQVDSYYDIYEGFKFRYRAYGMSENLTFTYGYVLGIFAGYSIVKMKYNFLYTILFISFVFGVSVNARIGFLPIIISIVFVVGEFFFKNVFSKFKFSFKGFVFFSLISALVCLLMFCFLFDFFSVESSLVFFDKFKWSFMFFEELLSLFIGGKSNTIDILLNDFIIIPDSFNDFIFGTGESIYLLDKGNSDIGYVLQLNYAGFILLFLIFFLTFILVLRLYIFFGFSDFFFYIFTFSIFFLNFKGFLFAATPGARFLFLSYMFYISSRKIMYLFK